jgi:hypothetical protein
MNALTCWAENCLTPARRRHDDLPKSRFTERTVRASSLLTACRIAASPTSTSPVLAKATTDGVLIAPSAFGITVASVPSMTATIELATPKSIPTARCTALSLGSLGISPVLAGDSAEGASSAAASSAEGASSAAASSAAVASSSCGGACSELGGSDARPERMAALAAGVPEGVSGSADRAAAAAALTRRSASCASRSRASRAAKTIPGRVLFLQ